VLKIGRKRYFIAFCSNEDVVEPSPPPRWINLASDNLAAFQSTGRREAPFHDNTAIWK